MVIPFFLSSLAAFCSRSHCLICFVALLTLREIRLADVWGRFMSALMAEWKDIMLKIVCGLGSDGEELVVMAERAAVCVKM